MPTITLTRGFKATINRQDADLCRFKWYTNNTGYACRNYKINGKRMTLLLHRVILSRKLGRELSPFEEVDHKDRNRLNDRRGNLRLANDSQNAANRIVSHRAKSGFTGVTAHRRKWRARIRFHKKVTELGLFFTAEAAAKAYKEAAKKFHGEFVP